MWQSVRYQETDAFDTILIRLIKLYIRKVLSVDDSIIDSSCFIWKIRVFLCFRPPWLAACFSFLRVFGVSQNLGLLSERGFKKLIDHVRIALEPHYGNPKKIGNQWRKCSVLFRLFFLPVRQMSPSSGTISAPRTSSVLFFSKAKSTKTFPSPYRIRSNKQIEQSLRTNSKQIHILTSLHRDILSYFTIRFDFVVNHCEVETTALIRAAVWTELCLVRPAKNLIAHFRVFFSFQSIIDEPAALVVFSNNERSIVRRILSKKFVHSKIISTKNSAKENRSDTFLKSKRAALFLPIRWLRCDRDRSISRGEEELGSVRAAREPLFARSIVKTVQSSVWKKFLSRRSPREICPVLIHKHFDKLHMKSTWSWTLHTRTSFDTSESKSTKFVVKIRWNLFIPPENHWRTLMWLCRGTFLRFFYSKSFLSLLIQNEIQPKLTVGLLFSVSLPKVWLTINRWRKLPWRRHVFYLYSTPDEVCLIEMWNDKNHSSLWISLRKLQSLIEFDSRFSSRRKRETTDCVIDDDSERNRCGMTFKLNEEFLFVRKDFLVFEISSTS